MIHQTLNHHHMLILIIHKYNNYSHIRCDNTYFHREVSNHTVSQDYNLIFDMRTSNPKSRIISYLTKYFVTMLSTVCKLVCVVQAHNWPNTTSILKQICTMKYPIINLHTPNNAERFWQWCNKFIKNVMFYSINDHYFLKLLHFRSLFSFCHHVYIGW
jgi:hypothetical protein